MIDQQPLVISGSAHPTLTHGLASSLGLSVAQTQTTTFGDGELHVRLLDPVAVRPVLVMQAQNSHEALLESYLLIDTARRSGARPLYVVLPYFAYGRQDRRSGQEPLSAALNARFLEAAGAEGIILLDLHNAAVEGCFHIPVVHMQPAAAFIAAWQAHGLNLADLTIVAPDPGGIKRALLYQQALGHTADPVVLDKRRSRADQAKIFGVSGDVAGKTCMLVDDIISTGGTLLEGAAALYDAKARAVFASATHLVLPTIASSLDSARLDGLYVSNSLPTIHQLQHPRLHVVDVAPVLAEAARRLIGYSTLSLAYPITSSHAPGQDSDHHRCNGQALRHVVERDPTIEEICEVYR